MGNSSSLNSMLSLIDKRIQKYLKGINIVTQYVGVVVGDAGNNNYYCRIAGTKTNFTFPNKTNQILYPNDTVYIQAINNDLNTGIITAAFKIYE